MALPHDQTEWSSEDHNRIAEAVGSVANPDGTLKAPAVQAALGGSVPLLDERKRVNAAVTARRGGLPGIVSLIAGQDDETLTAGNCVVTSDATNYKINGRGWMMTNSGTGHMTAYTALAPVVAAAQSVCLWLYVADATKLVGCTIFLHTDAGLTSQNRFSKNTTQAPTQSLVTGWNFIRVNADFGLTNLATWSNFYRVTVDVDCGSSTAGTTVVTIGHCYLEVPEKARILIVQDGGYSRFWRGQGGVGYPQLKALGVPVTLAADVSGKWGTGSGTYFEVIAAAEAQAFMADGNGNSLSIHSYDGSVTSSMTAAQIRADSMKAIKWIQQNGGYAGRMWRAAYVQNDAPQYKACTGLFVGQASGLTSRGSYSNVVPFIDPYDIARTAMDNSTMTTTLIDSRFAWLQRSRMLDVLFFHGIGTTADSAFATDPTLFNYFVSSLEAALSAGWLECVTFEQLFYEMGGHFEWVNGANVAVWNDASGTRVTQPVL